MNSCGSTIKSRACRPHNFTIAIGTTARAGTGFAFNDPGGQVDAGFNIIAIGGRAEANRNSTTAVGANSNVGAEGGVTLGTNTSIGGGADGR